MRKLLFGIFFVSLIVFSGIFISPTKGKIVSNYTLNQDTELVIYTYDSLFADPYFDITGNFSEFSGIPKEKINMVLLGDANEIVTRLIIEKDSPQVDVVIGIDNALIHLIEDKDEVLEPYNPINIDQLDSNLIQNLDPEKYLIPYDYGIISLYYQNQIINSTTNPELTNLTLDLLLESDLLSKLIVENPIFSSPGLGFLLWTIAVYGDPELNFDGLLGENWRNWWNKSRNEVTITQSWGDAFNIFFTPEEEKPIMVSYGTSPAYGYCQWQDDSSSAEVTYENNSANAWLQIEGLGLVKNAPHRENGKQFIDWFLSTNLQSELPEHQWMYPANTEAQPSECFIQSAIHPEEVNRLNDLITPTMLKKYLTKWQDDWEQVIVLGYYGQNGSQSIPSFYSSTLIFSLSLVSIPVIIRQKIRKT
ncbi:MAG: thiamine ABC transporter substrate-binding protein [Candidatus Hodarchaeales archaeon]